MRRSDWPPESALFPIAGRSFIAAKRRTLVHQISALLL
jgi:hypothetical protein